MDALSFSVVYLCDHCRIAEVAALVVDSCSGMCMAGFTGVAPRAVFLPSVVRPKMLDTLAGKNQKDSYQRPVLGSYCWSWCFCTVFPFIVGRPVLPGIMPVYATTGFLVRTVQKVVQFLDKLFSPVVVQRQVPELVRRLVTCPLWALMVQTVLKSVVIPQVQFLDKVTVMPVAGFHGPDSTEARGDSTGAVLGQGYGHNDRFHGPDSFSCLGVPQLQLIFKVADFPVVTMRLSPSLFHCRDSPVAVHLVVDVPLVLLQCPWFRQCRTPFGGSAGAGLRVGTSLCSCSDRSSCRRISWKVPQTSPPTSSRIVSEVGFCIFLRAFFGLRPLGR